MASLDLHRQLLYGHDLTPVAISQSPQPVGYSGALNQALLCQLIN
jgi:hypothetical protein